MKEGEIRIRGSTKWKKQRDNIARKLLIKDNFKIILFIAYQCRCNSNNIFKILTGILSNHPTMITQNFGVKFYNFFFFSCSQTFFCKIFVYNFDLVIILRMKLERERESERENKNTSSLNPEDTVVE